MVAKTCGFTDNKKITYSFTNEYHTLCIDKKDLISAQLNACEKLSKYADDLGDRLAIKK